jgi:hypothetical protein
MLSQNSNKKLQYWPIYGALLLLNLGIIWLFLSGNYQRDWSTRADQELTLAYNAVRINSGLVQEFFDHPGFVTIQLIAVVLREFYAYGQITILTITDLNSQKNLFDSFNQIVVAARFVSLIATLALINICFFIINQQLKNGVAAIALSIAVFFSTSAIEHFLYLRTELITFILLLLATLSFSRATHTSYVQIFLNLLCGCTLLFLAAVNKAQVLLYFPIYLVWALTLSNSILDRNLKTEVNLKLRWVILTITVNIVFFVFMASGISKLHQIAYIASLNIVIYLSFKPTKNVNLVLALFNLSYLMAYWIVAAIVWIFGRNITLFFRLINSPLEMLKWASLNQATQENAGVELGAIAWRLLSPFQNLVLRPDSQALLLILNLVLGGIFYKKISTKLWGILLTGLGAFYVCSIISSTRYWAAHYFIFSEFFLFANLVLIIQAIGNRKLQIFISLGICIAILLSNLPVLMSGRLMPPDKRSEICASSYLPDWQHAIDTQLITGNCAPYLEEAK